MDSLLAEITWRPSIGDPDALGWSITVAYLVASWFCVAAGRSQHGSLGGSDGTKYAWFWYALAALMFGLGLNKQLDVQILLIQIGVHVAREGGWYKQRQRIMAIFILVCACVGFACLIGAGVVMRGRWRQHFLAYVGVVLLLAFIVVRSAFPQSIDRLHSPNSGVGHWINAGLELGGTILVALGALFNTRQTNCSLPPRS
jgi:hypothetical protein